MRGLNPRTPTINDFKRNVKEVTYEIFVVCSYFPSGVCAGAVDYPKNLEIRGSKAVRMGVRLLIEYLRGQK